MSKTYKLKLLRLARIFLGEGRTNYSCVALYIASGMKAVNRSTEETWYSQLSILLMRKPDKHWLSVLDFDGMEHREMWLAMLQTLIRDGVVQ